MDECESATRCHVDLKRPTIARPRGGTPRHTSDSAVQCSSTAAILWHLGSARQTTGTSTSSADQPTALFRAEARLTNALADAANAVASVGGAASPTGKSKCSESPDFTALSARTTLFGHSRGEVARTKACTDDSGQCRAVGQYRILRWCERGSRATVGSDCLRVCISYKHCEGNAIVAAPDSREGQNQRKACACDGVHGHCKRALVARCSVCHHGDL